MDPVSAALPQNLQRIFVATMVSGCCEHDHFLWFDVSHEMIQTDTSFCLNAAHESVRESSLVDRC